MSKYPTQDEMRAGWQKRGRGVDFDVATEVMGWKVAWIPAAYDGHFPPEPYWKGPEAPTLNGGQWSEWQPTRNRDQCAQAELRLIDRGLLDSYGRHLLRILRGQFGERTPAETWALLAMMPPDARCHAMLAALSDSET